MFAWEFFKGWAQTRFVRSTSIGGMQNSNLEIVQEPKDCTKKAEKFCQDFAAPFGQATVSRNALSSSASTS